MFEIYFLMYWICLWCVRFVSIWQAVYQKQMIELDNPNITLISWSVFNALNSFLKYYIYFLMWEICLGCISFVWIRQGVYQKEMILFDYPNHTLTYCACKMIHRYMVLFLNNLWTSISFWKIWIGTIPPAVHPIIVGEQFIQKWHWFWWICWFHFGFFESIRQERWGAGVETHFQEISWNLRPVVNGT